MSDNKKPWIAEYPRPVKIWLITVVLAIIYLIVRIWMVGLDGERTILDNVIGLYGGLSLLIFLGFFHTKDPA